MSQTRTSDAPVLRPRLVAGVAGFWLFVALFVGLQGTVSARLGGEPVFDPGALVKAAAVWVFLTLGAVWLATRFPVRGKARGPHLALHLAAAGSVTFLLDGGVMVLDEVLGTGAGVTGVESWVAGSVRWLHINALVYGVVVALVHGVAFLKERETDAVRRAELEARLARAELRALRAQLHPHFLFNALHTVGLLWRTGRGEEAQETMERLGDLLRRVTDPGRPQETTLAEEMELVREYLAVEKVRFGDRLRLEERMDPGTLGAWVPSLVLQPLVENAVRHGVEGRSGTGLVAVEAERISGGLLEIRVLDDGPGPPDAWDQGVGLGNTRERLERLYGARGELSLEARDPVGARSRLRIPFRDAPVTGESDGATGSGSFAEERP